MKTTEVILNGKPYNIQLYREQLINLTNEKTMEYISIKRMPGLPIGSIFKYVNSRWRSNSYYCIFNDADMLDVEFFKPVIVELMIGNYVKIIKDNYSNREVNSIFRIVGFDNNNKERPKCNKCSSIQWYNSEDLILATKEELLKHLKFDDEWLV